MKKITAKTFIEMKARLRKEMGWEDKRTWTVEERKQVSERFSVFVDYKNDCYVAEENEPS